MSLSNKPPVFLALDVDDVGEALHLAKSWSPYIKGFKVGPRLGFKLANTDWDKLVQCGEIFIDYKFYDIPSTVEGAVRAAFDKGASFCTVHAMNGALCLQRLSKLEQSLSQKRPFKILVVTLLTSFDQKENMLPLLETKKPEELVSQFAQVVFDSGLSGIVCSSYELQEIKTKNPRAFCVTPGIRFKEDASDDQARVATPKNAWATGSDYLVMGRSLINTKNIEKTAKNLEQAWQTE